MLRLHKNSLLCASLMTILIACQKNNRELSPEPANTAAVTKANQDKGGTAEAKGTHFYALTAANELVSYRLGNPLREVAVLSVSGLASGERLLAIDFRPLTGQLYGVSSASKIYTINVATGQAMAVGDALTPAINGAYVGFDFNPTVDRIRLVTSAGQNLRLNPTTGVVAAVDGNLNPADARIAASAYTNSFAGATSTTLYNIDVATNQLFIQNPPNNGTLVAVGSLGVQAVGEAGFDIAPDNSIAIAALYGRGLDDEDQGLESEGNKYRFYSIQLSTGKAKNAGKTNRMIVGVAISPK